MEELIRALGGSLVFEGADIVGVFLPHTRITSTQLPRLASLPRLDSIDLSAIYFNATSLSSDLLAWILARPSIRSLQFNGADLDSVSSLAGFNSLLEVNLQGLAVSDAVAAQILSPDQTVALSVGATTSRKKWWPNLSHSFPGYAISDTLLDQAVSPILKHVSLRGTGITNGSLQSIGAVGSIQSIDVGQTSIDSDGLRELVTCRNLRRLVLDGTDVTDTGIAELTGLSGLELLNLNNCRLIGDAACADIADLSAIKSLHLNSTRVTNTGVRSLASLSDLTEVDLSFTATGNEAVEALGGQPITQIRLNGSRVGDVGAAMLSAFQDLVSLEVAGLQFSLDGWEAIGRVSGLEELDARRTSLSASMITELNDISNLKRLDVSDTAVSDDGMCAIGGFRNLQELNASIPAISDAGVAHILQLESLKAINLLGTGVTGSNFDRLASSDSMESLMMYDSSIKNIGLEAISGWRNLEALFLDGSSEVGDSGIAAMSGLSKLHTVEIARTQVSDVGFNALSSLERLHCLSIHLTPITSRGISAFIDHPNLQSIYLDASQLPTEVFEHLRRIPRLREIVVFESISDSTVNGLVTVEQLQEIHIRQSNISDAGLLRIGSLPKLRRLIISSSAITNAGEQSLRARKPDLELFVRRVSNLGGHVDFTRRESVRRYAANSLEEIIK